MSWFEEFFQDLRYSARMLLKFPGFTAAAALTLALGIGSGTAIFSVFDGFVLQPPRVDHPEQVVQCRFAEGALYSDYLEFRDHCAAFAGLVAYDSLQVVASGLQGSDSGETLEEKRISAELVSANYFDVLGGRALRGRMFRAADDRESDGQPLAVLSQVYWQRSLGADPEIVGKTLELNGIAFTVIGVAAADFGGLRTAVPDAWLPINLRMQLRGREWVSIAGRIVSPAGRAKAQAEMDAVVAQIGGGRADSRLKGLRLSPVSRLDAEGRALPIGLLLMLATGMVLLLVSANVANLALARASTRQREMGVRLALGATRGRIIRQLLAESAMLGLLGGLFGLLFSSATTRVLLTALLQQQIDSLAIDFSPNLRIIGCAVAISLASGALVGAALGLQAFRADFSTALKGEGSVIGRPFSRSRLRDLLSIGQIAVCLALLSGAGLLVRGLQKGETIDPGFDAKHVLVVKSDLQSQGYDPVRREEFYRSLAERLRHLPQIKAVAWSAGVPLQGGFWRSPVRANPNDPPKSNQVRCTIVSPDFFGALGLPIVRGRIFKDEESGRGASVAIINEALARRLWPGENPIGKQLYSIETPSTEVVGVVANSCNTDLSIADEPYVYFLDRPGVEGSASALVKPEMSILIRAQGDPRAIVAAVRGAASALDPDLRPALAAMEQGMGEQLRLSRAGAKLSAGLGVLALLVTLVGLYGGISYAASRRTREIGIRAALGADAADVRRLVMRDGLRLVAFGIALGLAIAIALGRMLTRFVYGLDPLNPAVLGSVSLFLAAIALVACWLPARRAAKVDPMTALRAE